MEQLAENWSSALTDEEKEELVRVESWRGWLTIAVNWGIIAGAFALVAYSPGFVTVLIAMFLIGARQLGLAVVMHEAAHRSLLADPVLNDRVGNWLAAYPVWSDCEPYRLYHLQHHAKTWTEEDPDLALAQGWPAGRASMMRKIVRDLTGQTGWKRARATLRRDLGISRGKVKRSVGGLKNLRGVIITNAVLLALLALTGHPELYLLWIASWLTTYSLVMRIRAIAEHSMIADPADPMGNTRTTLCSWWERLFIAPSRVNYHLEHHLMMRVPHYKLPRLHRMLRERGALREACVTKGYAQVLRMAMSDPALGTGAAGAGGDTSRSMTWG